MSSSRISSLRSLKAWVTALFMGSVTIDTSLLLLLPAPHLDGEGVVASLALRGQLAGHHIGLFLQLAIEDLDDLRDRSVGQSGADLDRLQQPLVALHPHHAARLAGRLARPHLVHRGL